MAITLKAARVNSGLTQTEAAQLIGINLGTLVKYEKGYPGIPLVTIQKMLETYGVRFDDIDFSSLPDQFVLKTTHDSGGVVICKDKLKFDKEKAKKKLEPRLKQNFYWHGREWPYKNVKPRILAEAFLEDLHKEDVDDYKVHCFNGVPRFVLVCKDRFAKAGMTEDFFNCSWEHIDVKRPNHDNSKISIEEPDSLKEIIELSRRIAKDIPFARTDVYSVKGKIYFGEITFFPSSGFVGFDPEAYDKTFGGWLVLPDNQGG